MKYRFCGAILFLICFFIMNQLKVEAYDAIEHNAIMNEILFGKDYSIKSKSDDIKDAVKMLEYASYLCVDQFNGHGVDKLYYLIRKKVRNIPRKISEIDFEGNSTHRSYTHRGWNFTYVKEEGKDKANWPVRKEILTATVDKIFDFGFWNEFAGNTCAKCDSFSATIYYIHILGDHLEAEKYTVDSLIIPFVRVHPGEDNPDVAYEMKKHFEILFENQKKTHTYVAMIQDLDLIAEQARIIAGSTGGVNTDSEFLEYKKLEEQYKEILVSYIPILLKGEEFFNCIFY